MLTAKDEQIFRMTKTRRPSENKQANKTPSELTNNEFSLNAPSLFGCIHVCDRRGGEV